jgi:hypothetical protein
MNHKNLSIEERFDAAKNKLDSARENSATALGPVSDELEKLIAHIALKEISIVANDQHIKVSIGFFNRYWKKPKTSDRTARFSNRNELTKHEEDPSYNPKYTFEPESQFETYLIQLDQENSTKNVYQVSGNSKGKKKKLKLFEGADDCISYLVDELAGWSSEIKDWFEYKDQKLRDRQS